MVMAAEIFRWHPGIGTAGFEKNLIVTESGPEPSRSNPDAVLVNTPPSHVQRFDSLPRIRIRQCPVHHRNTGHTHNPEAMLGSLGSLALVFYSIGCGRSESNLQVWLWVRSRGCTGRHVGAGGR